MAGGKKKKTKVVANPARGFATVSIASKPKEPKESSEKPIDKSQIKDDSLAIALDDTPAKETTTVEEESPEDFLKRLEEEAIQRIVEISSTKVKQDVQRQLSKTFTERRLLRGQADSLPTEDFLAEDLIDQLLNERSVVDESQLKPGVPVIRDQDNLLVKLWTLSRTLHGLGFEQSAIHQVMISLAKKNMQGVEIVPKDSIWGLQESLEWLLNECDPPQDPKLDEVTVMPEEIFPDILELDDEEEIEAQAKALREKAVLQAPKPVDTQTPTTSSLSVSEDESSGDSDDDDPEVLSRRFSRWMKKLYILDPKRADECLMKLYPKSKTGQIPKSDPLTPSPHQATVQKLMQKLQSLSGDVLFDSESAILEWKKTLITLKRQEAAAARAKAKSANTSSSDDESSSPSQSTPKTPASDVEDSPGLMADMFAEDDLNLDQLALDSVAPSITPANTIRTRVRDFGRFSGLNPQRILKEVIALRESSAKLTFVKTADLGMSKKVRLHISWKQAQRAPIAKPPCEDFTARATLYRLEIEMTGLATPDFIQAEAYAATCALFCLAILSPKDEKAYLRLPNVWKDLWDELAKARQASSYALDCIELREIRDLLERNNLGTPAAEPLAINETQKVIAKEKLTSWNVDASEFVPLAPVLAADPSRLMSMWAEKSSSPAFRTMLQGRMQLPIWQYKAALLDGVESNQVMILAGETGCGKSTQLPSYILENELAQGRDCRIICTEPRRISAISLARRVSEEIGEKYHELGTNRSMVGYSIRLESKTSQSTRLTYATTGVVLRMLESDLLTDITHLIIDEVHERNIDSDFLLLSLRSLLPQRPDLKVILMSATIDGQKFSNYLNGAPLLEVPGRTFPVEVMFLEDALEITGFVPPTSGRNGRSIDLDEADDLENEQAIPAALGDLANYSARTRSILAQFDEYRIEFELIVKLLETVAFAPEYVEYNKAVLVFLPGIAEIRKLNDMLLGHPSFMTGWLIHPLHSTIAMEEQEKAFAIPPPGVRKIVLSTNIAETGVTVPDITCIIDTGKHREMRFDERRQLSKLQEVFISRANAKQRRGRAGRVQNGLCFHLFTKARFETMMNPEQTPEMLRLSLQDLVLRVKICNLRLGSIEQTLSAALDPPIPKNVRRAIDYLIDVKALTSLEELTPLGRQLAKLPLDVFLGKLLLYGVTFLCTDAALTIAAILTSKSPFIVPFGARQQADTTRLGFKRGNSDLLTDYNAYLAWKRACKANKEQDFCRKSFLSPQNLSNIEELKAQLTRTLVEMNFLALDAAATHSLNTVRHQRRGMKHFVEIPERYDTCNSNDTIISCVIACAFYPKILVRQGAGFRNLSNSQAVRLHPASVNKTHDASLKWLSYYSIMQGGNKLNNAQETTGTEAFAVATMCGDVGFKLFSGVMAIDGNKMRFTLPSWTVLRAVSELTGFVKEVTNQAFRSPGKELSAKQKRMFEIWVKVFSPELRREGKDRDVLLK